MLPEKCSLRASANSINSVKAPKTMLMSCISRNEERFVTKNINDDATTQSGDVYPSVFGDSPKFHVN